MSIASPPLTFPRDLIGPDTIADCVQKMQRQMVTASTRGGTPVAADIGRPLWTWRYRTRPLEEAEALAWEAWLDSLRGGLRSFRAYHPLRQHLVAYPNGYAGMIRAVGGSSFAAGTGAVVSLGGLLDTVTVNNLPASLQFRAGDVVSIAHPSNKRGLYRVAADAAAGGTGVAVLTVEPTLLPGIVVGAEVLVLNAYAHAALDAKSIDSAWSRPRRAVISFSAQQVL